MGQAAARRPERRPPCERRAAASVVLEQEAQSIAYLDGG